MPYAEREASVLRAAGRDRLIVRIEGTGAVVELQLARPLTPLELAQARRVTPLTPCPAVVTPGRYSDGAFRQSHAEVAWPKAGGYKRVVYSGVASSRRPFGPASAGPAPWP